MDGFGTAGSISWLAPADPERQEGESTVSFRLGESLPPRCPRRVFGFDTHLVTG